MSLETIFAIATGIQVIGILELIQMFLAMITHQAITMTAIAHFRTFATLMFLEITFVTKKNELY